MNKKILTIAITCSFCFLLITNYVVADKPEWAGKPEGIVKQAEKAKEEAERKAEKAKEEAEREARKAERKAAKEAKKAAKKINE